MASTSAHDRCKRTKMKLADYYAGKLGGLGVS